LSSGSHWRSVLSEVERAGLCSNPVRLRGLTLAPTTGELVEGDLVVACKDRRASVCPSCSRLYQDDAFHLVAAGIRGGKGVDPGVAAHPMVFVTLTAPSFGPVHRGSGTSKPEPCRPRRRDERCPHRIPLACFARHGADDPAVGEPLCPQCFDYPGAVLWNAHVPRLWERTSLRLYRLVAQAGAFSTSELRASARLSYVKVVEFQRRGLVHLHVVLRADGAVGPAEAPPDWIGAALLERSVREAARSSDVALPAVPGTGLRRARWGSQIDVRVLDPGREHDSGGVAAYVAKYATKTADGTGWLAHPLRSRGQLERLALRPHVARLVRTAWDLGHRRELRSLALRSHAHTLGYRGQFSSKSRRFSTTFGALRGARAAYVEDHREDRFDYDGEWRYAGRGYDSPEATELARNLHHAAHQLPQRVPHSFPISSHVP
jgi:hypothetical protein